jgi:hypothetical protein
MPSVQVCARPLCYECHTVHALPHRTSCDIAAQHRLPCKVGVSQQSTGSEYIIHLAEAGLPADSPVPAPCGPCNQLQLHGASQKTLQIQPASPSMSSSPASFCRPRDLFRLPPSAMLIACMQAAQNLPTHFAAASRLHLGPEQVLRKCNSQSPQPQCGRASAGCL